MKEICLPPLTLALVILLIMAFVFGIEETKQAFTDKFNSFTKKEKKQVAPVAAPVAQVAGGAEGYAEEEEEEGYTEEFNNDLYKAEVDIDSSDYESALKNMVLEPEIMEQHQKFNSELMKRTGGTSSHAGVMDHNTDINPFVGLKRPQYQAINPNDGSARTVPSVVNADDLTDYNHVSWSHASQM